MKRTESANATAEDAPEHDLSRAHLADVVHGLRNGLAGVRGAVQVVREPMPDGMERDILGEVLHRIDELDRLVLTLASTTGKHEP